MGKLHFLTAFTNFAPFLFWKKRIFLCLLLFKLSIFDRFPLKERSDGTGRWGDICESRNFFKTIGFFYQMKLLHSLFSEAFIGWVFRCKSVL